MRILVIGAGDMGSGVVEDLLNSGVDVVVGDIDREKLNRFSKNGLETLKINVLDSDAAEKVRSVNPDVIVSAVGPFYRFGEATLKLAIDAGKDFVDICDDYDAAQKELSLDKSARDAGITAVVGCGWTPGISNMLAKYAYERIGGAESIEMDWVGSAADSEGLAVVMHVFHALTGKIPQYKDGKIVNIDAGGEGKKVDIPEFGNIRTLVCGHPEPVTIPRYLNVKEVVLRGALVPEWQNGLVKFFVNLGFTSTNSRKERLSKFIHRIEGIFRTGGKRKSAVRVEVTSGRQKEVYAAVERMFRLTGFPASICAQMIALNEFDKGVFAPEGILPAKEFLNELVKRDIRFYAFDKEWKRIDEF
jgi:saccharopine dehydrogenase-like NADP-dependent oxidoreductase